LGLPAIEGGGEYGMLRLPLVLAAFTIPLAAMVLGLTRGFSQNLRAISCLGLMPHAGIGVTAVVTAVTDRFVIPYDPVIFLTLALVVDRLLSGVVKRWNGTAPLN
jgi:hypothetical protein